MKKIFILLALISFGSIFSSCKDEKQVDDDSIHTTADGLPPRDKTLAGSIAWNSYFMEAEGTSGGVVLDINTWSSCVNIEKVSDSEVSFFIYSEWDGAWVNIIIPAIPVLGEPYNAAFDYATKDATVLWHDIKYQSVDASIKGWMKCIDKIDSSQASDNTRSMPSALEYTCDINITCLVDGETLHLKITSLF